MSLDLHHEARRIATLTDTELHRELGDHEAMSSLLVREIRRRQADRKAGEG